MNDIYSLPSLASNHSLEFLALSALYSKCIWPTFLVSASPQLTGKPGLAEPNRTYNYDVFERECSCVG